MSTIGETRSGNGSFYESQQSNSLELAQVAENVKFTGFKPVKAKFFIKLYTPSVETEKATKKRNNKGIEETNYAMLTIPPHLLFAFINSDIQSGVDIETDDDVEGKEGNQKFMTFGSRGGVIPKGTTFIIGFLGGIVKLDRAVVIGLTDYSVSETK